jgi:hypothetical protein
MAGTAARKPADSEGVVAAHKLAVQGFLCRNRFKAAQRRLSTQRFNRDAVLRRPRSHSQRSTASGGVLDKASGTGCLARRSHGAQRTTRRIRRNESVTFVPEALLGMRARGNHPVVGPQTISTLPSVYALFFPTIEGLVVFEQLRLGFGRRGFAPPLVGIARAFDFFTKGNLCRCKRRFPRSTNKRLVLISGLSPPTQFEKSKSPGGTGGRRERPPRRS